MARHLAELTLEEWERLVNDFADLVLAKHNVAGSIAGSYSLYVALEDERERAIGSHSPTVHRKGRKSQKR